MDIGWANWKGNVLIHVGALCIMFGVILTH